VEVLPLVALRRIPHAAKGIAGIFNYRGRPVPAVDLCELTLGQPAAERLSTRIIVVNYPDEAGGNHLLGLVAEHATEMVQKNAKDFVDPGVKVGAAPYLGRVSMDGKGVIQQLQEQRLLTESVRDLLFAQAAEPSHETD
jgi:chemotaxis-related protein WspB